MDLRRDWRVFPVFFDFKWFTTQACHDDKYGDSEDGRQSENEGHDESQHRDNDEKYCFECIAQQFEHVVSVGQFQTKAIKE